jgi:hypothetical protein
MAWNRVVTLEISKDSHKVKRIVNTREAAICLLRDWPIKSGYLYLRAVKGCARALKGELDEANARLYLSDAAVAAALRIQVSLGPSVLDEFDYQIAEICDQLAFEDASERS